MQRASFRSELSTVQLDEGSNTSWIMALKSGRYQHPVFGEIVISYDRAERFVLNEERRVRKTQMDIDYDHKRRRDDAAGWVVATENRGGDVWYQVEWTDEAAQKIRAKEYRYFSSEFADEWTDPETGTTHQDVLFGGGLTNRPFIKGMVPVNLSESEAEQARLAEEVPASTGAGGATEGDTVDLTKLRTKLKLSEGTSDEDVIKAALALADPAPAPVVEPDVQDLRKLAEGNPALAKILADSESQARRLAEMEASLTLSEVKRQLTELDEGAKFAITPAVRELAEPLLIKLPPSGRTELLGILRKFAEGSGTVQLGETGGTNVDQRTGGGDPVKQFTDLVKKIEVEDKQTPKEALRIAILRDPMLFESYQAETLAYKGLGV